MPDSTLPHGHSDVEPLSLTDADGADLELEADYRDQRRTKPIVVLSAGSGMDWGGVWLTPEHAREVAAWLTAWAERVSA